MAIEIVDLPSYKMVILHSYVSLPEGNGYKPKLLMVEALITIFGISY